MSITVYDCNSKIVGVFDDEVVRPHIANGTAKFVSSKNGRERCVYMSSERSKLSHEDLAEMQAGMNDALHSGTKYTYKLHFESAAPCHVLKRFNPETDTFERWPGE